MKVLVLANTDWAGVGNNLTDSLCRVGVDAKLYCKNKGLYQHKNNSITKNQAIIFSKKCNIIQYMHSEKVDLDINLKGKKIVVFHGGGKYRDDPQQICNVFNGIVDCSIIQTYDLFGLGAKNEKWLLPGIDVHSIIPVYNINNNKIIVGHYPSSKIGKGSETIEKIIKNIKGKVPEFEFIRSYNRVSWDQQLKRLSEVDIYIERMSLQKLTKNGWKRTGVWGMTALEAAALGKIVVTNFYGKKFYKKQFGDYALQVADSEKQMTEILINLLSSTKKELLSLKKETVKWVKEKHSLEVLGKRLRSIYENL
jgi:hypothetical protein